MTMNFVNSLLLLLRSPSFAARFAFCHFLLVHPFVLYVLWTVVELRVKALATVVFITDRS